MMAQYASVLDDPVTMSGELEVFAHLFDEFDQASNSPVPDNLDALDACHEFADEIAEFEMPELSQRSDLAEIEMLEDFLPAQSTAQISIEIDANVTPISHCAPTKLQGSWLFVELRHLFAIEDTDNEDELSSYVIKGKVRRVWTQGNETKLDVFWPALQEVMTLDHEWIDRVLPTKFAPPDKTELDPLLARELLVPLERKSMNGSMKLLQPSISPHRCARTMSKSEAYQLVTMMTQRYKGKKRDRGHVAPQLGTGGATKRRIKPSANYQLVVIPTNPLEIEGKKIYVELRHWYCEEQVSAQFETYAHLLVEGLVVGVQNIDEEWKFNIHWGVFNEQHQFDLEWFDLVKPRWGIPPGTRELSREEWCIVEEQQLQPPPVILKRFEPDAMVECSSVNEGELKISDTSDAFTVSNEDYRASVGEIVYVPLRYIRGDLVIANDEVVTKTFCVRGKIKRAYLKGRTPSFIIAWEALNETSAVEIDWFPIVHATTRAPKGMKVLSRQILIAGDQDETTSLSTTTTNNPPAIYRSMLALSLLNRRSEHNSVAPVNPSKVSALMCNECGLWFAVFASDTNSTTGGDFHCPQCT